MMKKFFLFLLLLLSFNSVKAQDIEYHSVGSNASFCAYRFDSENYIILSFKDDDENRLTENPILKILLTDGEVIKLQGADSSKKTSTHATNWGFGIISGGTSDKHYAVFYLSSENLEKLKKGIHKIAINTIPEVYKRVSKSDRLGKPLYEDFSKLKDEFDD